MNYRHVFHAGNHADVFKHAALVFILERLLEKPQPFAVLDTHAGVGLYDLTSDEARRSPEFQEGVGRIFEDGLVAAPAYSSIVREMNPAGLTTYPGSPEIVRRMLRESDRLMACELHPADAAELKARYRGEGRIAVHHRDGYEAVGALLPPPERRGLVLIDPPFEKRDEAARLIKALAAGLRKWPTGVFMAWYPLKDPGVGEALGRAAASFPKALRAEFSPFTAAQASLPGSGVLVLNTPFQLAGRLEALCEELSGKLGAGAASWRVEALTPH
jgi:23S rRNA (adenine2030-N6)-methyltransferase